jgi:hypothetical protein
MALPSISRLWFVGRRIEEIFKLQGQIEETFADVDERFATLEKAIGDRLRAVEDRLTRLEAEQGQVVSEAKSAATGAATMIASAVISDAVTRVTRVEEGLRRLEQLGNTPRVQRD